MEVLKYWDDPDRLFKNYMKKAEIEERKQMIKQEQLERTASQQDTKPPNTLKQTKSAKALKGAPQPQRNSTSMALLPIVENAANTRAMHEIEMIKKKSKDKELERKQKEAAQSKKQNQKDKRLKEELEKRRVEIGVASNVKGVKQEIKALILKEGPKKVKKFKNPLDQQIQLVDLNEEEDRDREILNQFMKKYAKIWKFMFQRYANQAYSTKGRSNFDDLGKKTQQINLAEITKILKDHNTYPLLISKDEIASLIRLINMHSDTENSNDLAMLDYTQFLQFIPQLAFLCFSRPPIDKSHLPSVESLKALLDQWEQATRDRGKSTTLFEDPEQSSFADKELIAALDKKLAVDPSYPVPEGFRKQIEKVPLYKYSLPECAAAVLSESQIVVTEVFDDILNEILGIHFLEPQVSFEIKTRIKPAIAKAKKKDDKAEALGYMKKAEKKQLDQEEALQKKGTAFAMMSAADKRKEQLEVKPKINLALKLQVTKQDLKNRPHFQEVAEAFEEILQAAEKGLAELPPRLNRAPG